MFGIIYKTTNLINGKVYIGQTTQNYRSYIGGGNTLKKDITKYGKRNFRFEAIDETATNLDELNEKEIQWIAFYRKQLGDSMLYNTDDGGNVTRHTHTEAARRKMSMAHTGKKRSKEHCETISRAKMGVPLSEKQRMAISAALKGHHLTEETKRKISEALKGKPQAKRSAETRRKIGEANSRRPYKPISDERKRKMSETMKKKWLDKRNQY